MNGKFDLVASDFPVGLSNRNAVTSILSAIPDSIAKPFQDYHELEVIKELYMKRMDCDSEDRAEICDTIKELSRNGDLTDARLNYLLLLYSTIRH